jgi:hypothetical protein
MTPEPHAAVIHSKSVKCGLSGLNTAECAGGGPGVGPGLQRQDLFQDAAVGSTWRFDARTGHMRPDDLKQGTHRERSFSGSSRIRCTTHKTGQPSRHVRSSCTKYGQDQLSNAIKCSARAPTHTNLCRGRDSTKTCQTVVDDTRQADPCVVWQPAKPVGSKVWSSRFPRGRSSKGFPLCALQVRDGRTRWWYWALQLDELDGRSAWLGGACSSSSSSMCLVCGVCVCKMTTLGLHRTTAQPSDGLTDGQRAESPA